MEAKRNLHKEEIQEILNGIIIPFDSITTVIKQVENDTRENLRFDLENVKIYPSMFSKFKKSIINSYNSSLIQPNFPIGPLVSDAFGQQATQTNLNTFHNVGSKKNFGADSIREAISLSSKRKIEYSTIHFKNESLNYKEVMELQKDFLGINVKFLSKSIKLTLIDFDSKENWWYKIQNNEIQNKKYCIRIVLDIQKLYEYKITTTFISNKIQKALSKEGKDLSINIKCIFSPTIYGIIDVFVVGLESKFDEYLVKFIQMDEFSKIMISGISEIKNFYVIKKPLSSIIRTSETKDNKLHLYINNNRFIGIPISKFIKLLEISGYKLDSSSTDINDIYTLFDYNSIKPIELRQKIIISSYGYKNEYKHKYYTVNKQKENTDGSSLWELDINLPYINSPYTPYSLENLLDDEFISFPDIPIKIDGIVNIEPNLEKRKFILISSSKYNNYRQSLYTINSIGNDKYQLTLDLLLIHSEGYTENDMNGFLNKDFNNFKIEESHNIEIRKELIISASDYISNDRNIYTVKKLKNTWKLTINNSLNLLENEVNEAIKEDFILFKGKHWEIVSSTILKPIKKIIIDTLDSYEEFLANISSPLTSKLDTELSNGKISINYNDNIIKLLIKSERDNFMIEDDRIIVNEDDLIKFKSDMIKTEDDIFKSYFYAETSGTSLKKILLNQNVNKHKTWCNNFHQIFEMFGIETLRNFLVFDFKSMINSNGYINSKFFELAADIETNTGLNPMTSEGIGAHGGSALKYATFDRVSQYLTRAMLSGKAEKTNSTSVAITLGQQFNFGTGGVYTEEDKVKINSSSPAKMTDQYDYNIKIDSYDNNIQSYDNGVVGEENDNQLIITVPIVIKNQLPIIPFIYNFIINKNPIFYIKQGINNLLNIKKRSISVNIINASKFITNKNKICKKILFGSVM